MSYQFDLHSIGDLSGDHAVDLHTLDGHQRLMYYQVLAQLAIAERLEALVSAVERVADELQTSRIER